MLSRQDLFEWIKDQSKPHLEPYTIKEEDREKTDPFAELALRYPKKKILVQYIGNQTISEYVK